MRKRRVLFLCTGNSCRSQMAEGLLRHLAGDRFEAASAGTVPSNGVSSLAVRAMAEIGLDISAGAPRSVDDLPNLAFDFVITVCDNANENCPYLPGQFVRLHWPFDDPAAATGTDEERMAVCRRVRDEIRAKLEEWLREAEWA
jgi:arsenate reductase